MSCIEESHVLAHRKSLDQVIFVMRTKGSDLSLESQWQSSSLIDETALNVSSLVLPAG